MSLNQLVEGPVSPSDAAPARIALYGFVLAIFDKPDLEQHAWLTGPDFARTFRGLCQRFDIEPPAALVQWSADEHESTYLACFEVGLPTPMVVLQASHYNRRAPAPRTIHEHERLYRLFDAKLAPRNLDQQDHLLNELAFLIHLDELVLAGAGDLDAIVRARRDFIGKHVKDHVGSALESSRKSGVPRVYAVALDLLASALDQDFSLSDAWIGSRTSTAETG
jgi:Nitrate reductase delta subunit